MSWRFPELQKPEPAPVIVPLALGREVQLPYVVLEGRSDCEQCPV